MKKIIYVFLLLLLYKYTKTVIKVYGFYSIPWKEQRKIIKYI
ncbi:hypothetical protein CBB2_3276 [Clostridium botulinum]|nr:hypothetical protein CBB2_3276 [Clostridium botulinum]